MKFVISVIRFVRFFLDLNPLLCVNVIQEHVAKCTKYRTQINTVMLFLNVAVLLSNDHVTHRWWHILFHFITGIPHGRLPRRSVPVCVGGRLPGARWGRRSCRGHRGWGADCCYSDRMEADGRRTSQGKWAPPDTEGRPPRCRRETNKVFVYLKLNLRDKDQQQENKPDETTIIQNRKQPNWANKPTQGGINKHKQNLTQING